MASAIESTQIAAMGAKGVGGIKPKIFVEPPEHGVDVGSAQQQRVAIRLRAGGRFGADPSPGTGKILNDNALSESGRERLRDQPSHNIGRTAGGERDDDLDCSLGIGLGIDRLQCDRRGRNCEQHEQPTSGDPSRRIRPAAAYCKNAFRNV
jgi:hypothetical protein